MVQRLRLRKPVRCIRRIAGEMGGTQTRFMSRVWPDGYPCRRRALADLKRVVDIHRGNADDRSMVYAGYRDAVNGGGRPARSGNRWGIRTEAGHDILLVSHVIDTLQGRQGLDRAHAVS